MKRVKLFALISLLFIGLGHAWGAEATLTQAEIKKATAGGSYAERAVESTSGTWTGKMIINTSTGFVQINKNSNNYYLGSPTFEGGVTKIVITTCNSTASGRTFYIMGNTNTAQPTSGTYGSGSTSGSNGTASIDITGSPTNFYIYANGAAYISSVTVTYATSSGSVTYTDYLTECAAESGYSVSSTAYGLVSDGSNPGTVDANADELVLLYSAAEKYVLPSTTDKNNFIVSVGGTNLTYDDGFYWEIDQEGKGNLHIIPTAGFTGNVVVTMYGKLQAPTDVQVSNVAANAAKITWTGNAIATKYAINLLYEDGEKYYTVDAPTTFIEVDDLTPETYYIVGVVAQDGNSPLSDSGEGNAEFTTEAAATYTITWDANGTTTTSEITQGEKIGTNLPDAPASCSGVYSTFVGWFTQEAGSDGSPSEAPQGVQVTAETVPDGNATYYAVFCDASGEAGWELVASTSALEAGATYTIASTSTAKSGKALGTQSTNNRAAVDWSSTTSPVELTLGGDATNGWTFYDATEGGYLYAASSSNNYLKTQKTNNANGQWSIAIAASGSAATIKAKGTNTNNRLQYNSSASVFSCYSTSQSDVYLFKKGGTATGYISSCCGDAAVVTVTPASTTLNLGGKASVSTSVTCSQTGGGSGAWTYSVSPADGATFVGTTFTATKAGTYTLTATYTENCGKSATATITVTDNPVYTVTWSVDGSITATQSYSSGDELVLPSSTPSGCSDKVFVGWTANKDYDNATTAPSDLFTEAKGPVTADANYYAVFAKESSSGAVSVGATLWSEDFGSYNQDTNTGDVPAGGTYSYSCQGSGTKVYSENYAGGTSPELLVAKNGGSFNAVIPTQGATEATLTYKSNKTTLPVTSTTEGVTLTKVSSASPFSYTISIPLSATSLNLMFKTSSSDNARLDDITLVVTGTSAYSEYTTSCSGRASMPVFTPASGATLRSGETVKMSCSTEGATIHYTLDGSEPTAESPLYTDEGVRISVQEAGSVTLKAIAIADGMGDSYVATAVYTVTLPAPTGVVFHANNGTEDYAAESVAYGSSEPICYFPTYAGKVFLGFYTSANDGKGTKLYGADGTMVLNVAGYTDSHGWTCLDNRIDLYAHWMVPKDIVINKETTNLDGYEYDLSTTDITITSTGTLTITKDISVHDVHVQSGGTLAITGGTLLVNSLHLYGGWQSGKTAYSVPSVYIASGASLSKKVSTVYLDLCIDNDHFYPFAVPFPVKISGTSDSEANMQGYHVRYAEDRLNQYAKYRTDGTGQVVIKRYDGARRAETGVAQGNWAGVAYNETLLPSEGYIIRAVPVSGQTTAVIRIEMNIPDEWTTDGEQAQIGSIIRNQISVTAHGADKANLNDTHKGWNMLGVPYLSYFGTGNWDSEGSGIAGGKVVIKDGKIVLDDKAVRYVSVPTFDFSEYIQTPLSATSLRPGWSFFVQIGKGGTLTFATNDRQQSSPLLAPAAQGDSEQEITLLLSHGGKSDHTGLILSDDYTTAYEIGADLEKMFGDGFTLSVYTLSGNTRLAYNALSREAATQLIPVGFRAPKDGEYTFSVPADSPTEGIERIDLIDYETGNLTNLLSTPYVFSATRTESSSRFGISITYSKDMPTDTKTTSGEGGRRAEKVLIQQQLYIIIDGKMYDATGKMVND